MSACPISKDKIDGNIPRINGFISLIFIALGVFNYIFWILLTIDFFLRSFTMKYSPIANFSKLVLNTLKIEGEPIDAAPKKFAVRIGLMMSIILITISLFGYHEFSVYFSVFFSIPVFLETFFGFCLGCKMYSLLIKMNIIKHKLNDSDLSNLTF